MTELLLLAALGLMQDAAALSREGAQALREQRYADAERAYRRLVETDPGNAMWRLNLGLTLHSAGRFAEAAPVLEGFVKAKPDPGPAHFVLGLSYLKLRQACKAVEPLQKARAWNPEQAGIELADAYYGCGRFEAAGRAYRAVLKTKAAGERGWRVQRQAAHCFWQARLYAEARRDFEALSGRFDDEAEYHYEYGDTLVRLEGAEAGLAHLERAVKLAPGLRAARGELGKALLELGRGAEAVEHLEKASADDAALLLPLSRAYRAAGRAADAARVEGEYRRKLGK